MPHRAMVHSIATVICRAWLACALFAWLAWPAAARAETTVCTVLDTLPATITEPGHYCLEQNFSQVFLGDAIRINVDDTVLDCNGHSIRHSNASSTSNGITSTVSRRNVTIRNCTIDSFAQGIYIEGYSGSGASEILVQGNTVTRFRTTGITGYGSSILIENNRITRGRADDGAGVMVGIYLSSFGSDGTGNTIRGNLIADLVPLPFEQANDTMGIQFGNVTNTEIADNVITGLLVRTGHCVWAIFGSGATGVSVTGNVITAPSAPPAAPNDGGFCGGISLFGTAPQQATNVCRDNVVGHFNGDITGCNKAGNTEL